MRTLRHTISVLLFLLLAAGCATAPKDDPGAPEEGLDPARLLAEGNEALERGDLDQAQIKYALAVEAEPDNVGALYRLGVVHNEQGSLDIAEGLLRRALKLNERHQGSLETLGIVMLKRERFDEAEQILSSALERRPDAWRMLDALGVINDMQGQHEQAREYLTAAAFIVPRSAKVANNLGYSHYLSGDLETAEEQFRKAVRFDPEYVHAWSNLGLVLSRQGRHRDAAAAFSKVVTDHQAANNLGFLSLLQEDETRAREQFERAIALSPSYYAIANRNLESLGRPRSRPTARATGTTDRDAERSAAVATSDARGVPQLTLGPLDEEEAIETLPEARPIPADRTPKATVATRGGRGVVEERDYLRFLGFDLDGGDGEPGSGVRAAVVDFQRSYGLKADGRVGPRTWSRLEREALKAVQLKLRSLGYDPGRSDGRLGARTEAAIRRFQADRTLPADGQLDGAVLQDLNAAIDEVDERLNSPDTLDIGVRG